MRTYCDSDHGERSWRTIQSVSGKIRALRRLAGREPLTDHGCLLDGNNGGQDTGEEGMQCATMIDNVAGLVTSMVTGRLAMMLMRTVMMVMHTHGIRNGVRAAPRSRNDPRQLANQKHCHKRQHQLSHRAEAVHAGVPLLQRIDQSQILDPELP